MNEGIEQLSASSWWEQRRLRYNFGLVVAGLFAFLAYASIISVFEESMPDAEITAFTVAFQGIGYLVAMVLANIFYLLGPVSEKILKPKNVRLYRKIAFDLGFWFSVLLPFSVPALAGYRVAMNT